MVKGQQGKPVKKTDKELWVMIERGIASKQYIIMPHAVDRQNARNVTDIDILDILENKEKRRRKRNKSKDKYEDNRFDWNYCIEGLDLDGERIRIIISFSAESNLLIITVIRPNSQE